MSRGAINRKTVRRSILNAHRAGEPITGVNARALSICLMRQMGAHPSQRQQIQEIVEALVALDDLSCRLIHRDAVLRPLTDEERKDIKDEQQANGKSRSWTCRPARKVRARTMSDRRSIAPSLLGNDTAGQIYVQDDNVPEFIVGWEEFPSWTSPTDPDLIAAATPSEDVLDRPDVLRFGVNLGLVYAYA